MFAERSRQPPDPTGWRGRLAFPLIFSRPNNRTAGRNYPYRHYGPGFHSGENLLLQEQGRRAQQSRCTGVQAGCYCSHCYGVPQHHVHDGRHGIIAPGHIHHHQNVHDLVPRPPPARTNPTSPHSMHRHRSLPGFRQVPEPIYPRIPAGRREPVFIPTPHLRTQQAPRSSRYDSSDDEPLMRWNVLGFDDSCCSSDDESSLSRTRRQRSSSLSSDGSSTASGGWSMLTPYHSQRRFSDWDDSASWSRERGNSWWFTPRWRT
ncbi:hypothetical protein CISG_01550 [Coccidioides immitis RMSCC 3703]|uniref:Uncharacterized protein n=2 Tax=Coccidioides immitis TaxID=5501 RepID=A0A0J8QY21_COCIT|nr:hypothetical protein CIRG_04945 [Coccidioides immitis RMSCC 2394]KMU77794.1 hypothetical protein CISG_01550 [Coccidioides immitis RMSCC 3703]